MKGGSCGPAISTGGAAVAALGSFLANGGPPSVAHGQGVTQPTYGPTPGQGALVDF
ncbi:hypothetical protein PF005_g3839 [Phytophthora fragariae]|uniref:Uncharacterized protein n=1 Tax=Phytophthora fragariae TaxID=53985 RepID=A0A6A3TH39_9STRA|nr:hypothetical protein PF003_g2426 [Phytophthora fragariae]KAE8946338.1 hypothetical protein PF009_g4041 [Phytophthora fragariae]KAE9030273.1 hypothetical protein PF011_g681 [Phytophthora fragariae]KAE9128800.1 hypothetical protein PF010_g4376 [Phytophthora fragariae]KAE9130427.1 hypothetical protein PF006_g15769 [Phytophthora fragariae]